MIENETILYPSANGTEKCAFPLRVCHIASGDAWAGAEVQLATLLRALSARPDIELRVILLNEGRLAKEVRDLGIDLVVIPQSRNGLVSIARKAVQFLSGRSVDVLHAHRDKEYIVGLMIRGISARPFLARTQHGRPEKHAGWIGMKAAVLHAVDRQLARWSAAKVISVSHELTRYLRTYLRQEQVAVVPNGIDIDRIHSELSITQARQKIGLAPDVPVIGSVARLVDVKRLDLFLKMAHIVSRTQAANFIIVGDGPGRQKLQRMADELGLSTRVKFLGNRADIYDVIRAMDMMVVTSDCEGMPMCVLEAMHLGVPVLSRAVGGISEVIENGATGILVESSAALTDACIQLLNGAGLRKAIANRATRIVAERYSSEANAEALVTVYRSIVDQSKSTHHEKTIR